MTIGPEGEVAERGYNDDVLTWGRGEHLKVERICQFYVDLGAKLPFVCRVEPPPAPPPH